MLNSSCMMCVCVGGGNCLCDTVLYAGLIMKLPNCTIKLASLGCNPYCNF